MTKDISFIYILSDQNLIPQNWNKFIYEEFHNKKVKLFSNTTQLLNQVLIKKPHLIVFEDQKIKESGIKVGSFTEQLKLNNIDYKNLRDFTLN